MFCLVVIEVMTPRSGHLSNINEISYPNYQTGPILIKWSKLYFILHAQPVIQILKRLLRAYPDGTLLLSEKGTYEILMQK